MVLATIFNKKTGIKQCILLSAALFIGIHSGAQVKVTEEQQDGTETVVLYADPRLAVLTAYHETSRMPVPGQGPAKGISGSIRSGKGYRVLIYSGIDRAKANQTKADFMKRFPGTRIYMTYALPQYRIKVGDYTSRHEANEFYRQLSSAYSPCMVVPDIIEINTFRKNDP